MAMALPANVELSIQAQPKPGDPTYGKLKRAMLVKMSSETYDALDTNLTALQVDFNGDAPGFYIGESFFPMRPLKEDTPHELYLRQPGPNKPNAPFKLHGNVVGKFMVMRELGDRITDRVREGTTAMLQSRGQAIMLDTPPALTPTNVGKKRKPPAASAAPKKPAAGHTNAIASSSNYRISDAKSLAFKDGEPTIRQRLIHCLAMKESPLDVIVTEVGGVKFGASDKREIELLLPDLAEQHTAVKSLSSGNRPWRLKPQSWLEVRPFDWPNINDHQRTVLAREARSQLHSQGIKETDPQWMHVKHRPTTGTHDAGHSRNKLIDGSTVIGDGARHGLSGREVKERKNAKLKEESARAKVEIHAKDETKKSPPLQAPKPTPVKTETVKTEPRTIVKPSEPRPSVKPEPRPIVKPEPRPVVKPEPKPTLNEPETKPRPRPLPAKKTDATPAPRTFRSKDDVAPKEGSSSSKTKPSKEVPARSKPSPPLDTPVGRSSAAAASSSTRKGPGSGFKATAVKSTLVDSPSGSRKDDRSPAPLKSSRERAMEKEAQNGRSREAASSAASDVKAPSKPLPRIKKTDLPPPAKGDAPARMKRVREDESDRDGDARAAAPRTKKPRESVVEDRSTRVAASSSRRDVSSSSSALKRKPPQYAREEEEEEGEEEEPARIAPTKRRKTDEAPSRALPARDLSLPKKPELAPPPKPSSAMSPVQQRSTRPRERRPSTATNTTAPSPHPTATRPIPSSRAVERSPSNNSTRRNIDYTSSDESDHDSYRRDRAGSTTSLSRNIKAPITTSNSNSNSSSSSRRTTTNSSIMSSIPKDPEDARTFYQDRHAEWMDNFRVLSVQAKKYKKHIARAKANGRNSITESDSDGERMLEEVELKKIKLLMDKQQKEMKEILDVYGEFIAAGSPPSG